VKKAAGIILPISAAVAADSRIETALLASTRRTSGPGEERVRLPIDESRAVAAAEIANHMSIYPSSARISQRRTGHVKPAAD